MICYGDSIFSKVEKKTIKVFKKLYNKKLSRYFDSIHFLPFYPSSSDSGFAVKDHYKIDKKFGSWSDISNFSKKNKIMADIVINHASARGLWFRNFLKERKPGKDYFLTVNNKFDTSKVVRPRDHRLLKKIDIFKKKKFIWRTFSADQIDLNFKNPSVLLRFIKIMIKKTKNAFQIGFWLPFHLFQRKTLTLLSQISNMYSAKGLQKYKRVKYFLFFHHDYINKEKF